MNVLKQFDILLAFFLFVGRLSIVSSWCLAYHAFIVAIIIMKSALIPCGKLSTQTDNFDLTDETNTNTLYPCQEQILKSQNIEKSPALKCFRYLKTVHFTTH